jgi:hypothetical protein
VSPLSVLELIWASLVATAYSLLATCSKSSFPPLGRNFLYTFFRGWCIMPLLLAGHTSNTPPIRWERGWGVNVLNNLGTMESRLQHHPRDH